MVNNSMNLSDGISFPTCMKDEKKQIRFILSPNSEIIQRQPEPSS